jgi:DNA repair exonuclease SbcCD nuclease subunit
MIKSVIHLADVHIRTYRMHDEYKEIFQTFIDEITEYCKDYKHEEIRIAIVGDLVHQKITISNEQLILSTWFLRELSKVGKVVIIAGNHDLLENNKDRVDSISPMIELLDNPHIAYYQESTCYLDDNVVWCNYSIFEGNERPDIEEGRAKHGDDKTYIGLYHAPIAGASTDVGYIFDDNHTQLNHFDGCDMVLLGDIHKRSCFYNVERKEIDETELEIYKKNGWVIDE